MSTSLDQMPWRSGFPHEVFGVDPALAGDGVSAAVVDVRRATTQVSDTAAMAAAMPADSSRFLIDVVRGAVPESAVRRLILQPSRSARRRGHREKPPYCANFTSAQPPMNIATPHMNGCGCGPSG